MHLFFFLFIFCSFSVCRKTKNVIVENKSFFIRRAVVANGYKYRNEKERGSVKRKGYGIGFGNENGNENGNGFGNENRKEKLVMFQLKKAENVKIGNENFQHESSKLKNEKEEDGRKEKEQKLIVSGKERNIIVRPFSKKTICMKDLCSTINMRFEEQTKELVELKINNDVSINNFFEKEAITQLVEAYWVSILQNKYFYYILKEGKPIIFSVSSGVDSLSTFYSFLFLMYKLIVFGVHKNENYSNLIQKIQEVYSYTSEDIQRIIQKGDAKENYSFFCNVLKNITLIYFNHKTRPECSEEQRLLKKICKEHNLDFKCKILTKTILEKLKRNKEKTKKNNNFLSLVRTWWRNGYMEILDFGQKIKSKEKKKKQKKSEYILSRGGECTSADLIDTMENEFHASLKDKIYKGSKKKKLKYTYKKYMSDIRDFVLLTNKKNLSISVLRREFHDTKKEEQLLYQLNVPNSVQEKDVTRYIKKLKGFVFLGHTQNDTNETILFKLFRGVSIKNLSGIEFAAVWKKCFLFRPFIKVNKLILCKYLLSLNKKWLFDKSNAKLDYSRNVIRNVIIPNISFLLSGKKKSRRIQDEKTEQPPALIKKTSATEVQLPLVTNAQTNELENYENYTDVVLSKRLNDLHKSSIHLQHHVNYYLNAFDVYIKQKYFDEGITTTSSNSSSSSSISRNNIFISEFTHMQNKLYDRFFKKDAIKHLIQIHKKLFSKNIFLKIFNINEFLLLPSKFIQFEALHYFFRIYANIYLTYANMEKVYDELVSFVANKKQGVDESAIEFRQTQTLKRKEREHKNSPSGSNGTYNDKEKGGNIKLVDLKEGFRLVLNRTFFRLVQNKPQKETMLVERNANIFIHNDLSAAVKRIDMKNIYKEKFKLYLLIKKRKKKKKERFHIHIRYLKKNDSVFYKKKVIRASKFLSKHNIPYIYKYALPIIQITNFPKNKNILFVSLFQDKIKHKNFVLKDTVYSENLSRFFLYGIHFKNWNYL